MNNIAEVTRDNTHGTKSASFYFMYLGEEKGLKEIERNRDGVWGLPVTIKKTFPKATSGHQYSGSFIQPLC